MMIALNAKTESEARVEIASLSAVRPGKYLIVAACFGLFAEVHNKLSAQAPSDTPFNWYALNGKLKQFTEAQHTANQKATPALS